MNRKVLTVFLMLTLLAGGVGLGIHLLHKDALADTAYTVQIYWLDEFARDHPLENATVLMSFFVNEVWSDWEEADELDVGKYRIIREGDDFENWQVWIFEPNVDPAFPGENPCLGYSSGYFVWRVFLL